MFTPTPNPAHESAFEAGTEELQRAYIWSINSAIEAGGESLADELAESYRHESRRLAQRRIDRRAA